MQPASRLCASCCPRHDRHGACLYIFMSLPILNKHESAEKCPICKQANCTFKNIWLNDKQRIAWLCSDYAGASVEDVSLPRGARDFWRQLLLHPGQQAATNTPQGIGFFSPQLILNNLGAANIHTLPMGFRKILLLLEHEGAISRADTTASGDTSSGWQFSQQILKTAWWVLDCAVEWLASSSSTDSPHFSSSDLLHEVAGADHPELPAVHQSSMTAVWTIHEVADHAEQQLLAAASTAWATGLPLVLASRPPPSEAGSGLAGIAFSSDAAQGDARELSLCSASAWTPPKLPSGGATVPANAFLPQLLAWKSRSAAATLPGSVPPSYELLAVALQLHLQGKANLQLEPHCGVVLLPSAESAPQVACEPRQQAMLQHLSAHCVHHKLHTRLTSQEAEAADAQASAKRLLAQGKRAAAKHALARAAEARRRCASLRSAQCKLAMVLSRIAQAQEDALLLGAMRGATGALSWHTAQSKQLLNAGVLDSLSDALQQAGDVQAALSQSLVPPQAELEDAAELDDAMRELEEELRGKARGQLDVGLMPVPARAAALTEPLLPGSDVGAAQPDQQSDKSTSWRTSQAAS